MRVVMSGEEDDPAREPGAPPCPVRAAIDRLCQELNLDAGSAAEALRDFTALRGTYSLEVRGSSCLSGSGVWVQRPSSLP